MRDVTFRRPVESIGRRAVAGPKPQWQDLFLAPAYSADVTVEEEFIEEPAVDWAQVSSIPQRRRPVGRRVAGRTAWYVRRDRAARACMWADSLGSFRSLTMVATTGLG